MSAVALLSLIVFLPAAAALLMWVLIPKESHDTLRLVSLAVTLAVFLLTAWVAWPGTGEVAADGSATRFALHTAGMQDSFFHDWIPAFNIDFAMGLDGISFPLVLLTSGLSVLAMWASWPIKKHVKAYCLLFLLLETGMLGVFVSLDFFLFYVFWEVMLLPMYFLIGVWGGPRREYAAIKFFLYTLLGGVFMLIALLMLYFASDLKQLSDEQLVASGVVNGSLAAEAQQAEIATIRSTPDGIKAHTFNLLALAKLGQTTDVFDEEILLGRNIQWWAFLLLFLGFIIKVPSVPFHTWLPDAHVEAPTPISMILAGVLLKMGGYGIIRICYPICPDGGFDLMFFVCTIGVVSMVYGAFAAMAQKDFKRLVAYSSVSHMGYVVLGLGVWSATAGNEFFADYWKMGMNGAMFQMIAHGVSSAGMFFLVGVIYDRVHHRNLNEFGGLFAKMPVYSGISFVIFFAALGLPGLCGFIGEVFVTLSVWEFNHTLAIVSAGVVILTAGYILWTLQRVYLGAEYKGPHAEELHDITPRELGIAVPLVALAILFGVFPTTVFNYMTASVNQTVDELAVWTREVKEPRLKQEAESTAVAAESMDAAAPARAALANEPITETASR